MDFDLCNGEKCPLKMTCRRYLGWLSLEPDEDSYHWETEPPFKNGKCDIYMQVEYYGQ